MNANRVVEDRFWSKVDKSGDCWEWQGSRVKDGYGEIYVPGGRQGAHRFAWSMVNGPVPDGVLILHTCDNPSCVNPAHLRLGTHAENMKDRNRKGRQAKGERHGRAKLSAREVSTIRMLYSRGNHTQRELAERYGVSSSTVGLIVRRERWT